MTSRWGLSGLLVLALLVSWLTVPASVSAGYTNLYRAYVGTTCANVLGFTNYSNKSLSFNDDKFVVIEIKSDPNGSLVGTNGSWLLDTELATQTCWSSSEPHLQQKIERAYSDACSIDNRCAWLSFSVYAHDIVYYG